jgi:hypothetical protein
LIFKFTKFLKINQLLFLKLGRPNTDLDKILSHFNNIHFSGNEIALPESVNWMNLFPSEFYVEILNQLSVKRFLKNFTIISLFVKTGF